MKKYFLICLLFSFGCATSPTHVGILWGHSQGPTSSSDAEKSMKIVEVFHQNVKAKKWDEVYSNLDKKLQSKINKSDFQRSIEKLDVKYGPETSFITSKNPGAELMKSMASPLDEGKTSDGFLYYDAILSRHLSTRDKNLVYVIGVTRPEKGSDLKINSIQVFNEKDGQDLVLKNPLLQISAGYKEVIK